MNSIVKRQLWDESYELEQLIFRELNKKDGLTDNELTERLKSERINFDFCRNLCLQLAGKGLIKRDRVQGEPLKNRIIKGDEKDPELSKKMGLKRMEVNHFHLVKIIKIAIA